MMWLLYYSVLFSLNEIILDWGNILQNNSNNNKLNTKRNTVIHLKLKSTKKEYKKGTITENYKVSMHY